MNIRLTPQAWGISALLAATLFWGSSIVVARVILREVPPFVLAHLGAVASALSILLPLALVAPSRLRFTARDWWRFALLGAGGFALGGWCINVGIQRTSAATAATLQYLAPTFTLLYGWLSGTERPTPSKVLAVALTFSGAALATGVAIGRFVFDWLGIAAAIGSAACFAFITIFSKTFAERYDPYAFTGYTFLVMALTYGLIDPLAVATFVLNAPRQAAFIVAYAVGLGVIPTILYFASLRWLAPTTTTVVLSFEIVVTSLLGWWWLGEQLASWQVLGAAMVIAAVIIIERSREPAGLSPASSPSPSLDEC